MKQVVNIWHIIFVLWALLLLGLNLNGNISFGHWLGDIYYLIFLVLFVSIMMLIGIKSFKKMSALGQVVFLIFQLGGIALFMLQLTIFRGPEFSWNGRLFLR